MRRLSVCSRGRGDSLDKMSSPSAHGSESSVTNIRPPALRCLSTAISLRPHPITLRQAAHVSCIRKTCVCLILWHATIFPVNINVRTCLGTAVKPACIAITLSSVNTMLTKFSRDKNGVCTQLKLLECLNLPARVAFPPWPASPVMIEEPTRNFKFFTQKKSSWWP